ncbi:MAG: hypothetical protein Kow00121_49180 [Elainellaceae cyanobacterium]
MKRHSIKWLSHFSQSGLSSGFTLTELLVAVAISGIGLTIAGAGIVTIMQSQQKASVEVSQRTNLNRALDFMAEEVRMANAVKVPVVSSVPTVTCGTATGVLELTIPNPGLPADQVVYYLQTLNGCSSNPWLGPAVIRRKYVSSNSTLSSDTVLTDALMAPTTPPSCTSGMTFAGSNGFYACISNDRTADLYLYGRLTDAYGNTNGTYPVSSQVSARSF